MVSVKDIENKTFQTVRFKEGYDVDDVDAFLDQVVARAKAGNPMTPAELAAQTFQTVRFKEGYDTGEVDEFLAELANGVTVDSPGNANNANPATSATLSDAATTANAAHTSGFGSDVHSDESNHANNTRVSGNDPFSGENAQLPW